MIPLSIQYLLIALAGLFAAASEWAISRLSHQPTFTAALTSPYAFLLFLAFAPSELALLLMLYHNGHAVSKLPFMTIAFSMLFCVIIGVAMNHDRISVTEGIGMIIIVLGIVLLLAGRAVSA